MKHIFSFIGAIFTFLIVGAYPIMAHAAYTDASPADFYITDDTSHYYFYFEITGEAVIYEQNTGFCYNYLVEVPSNNLDNVSFNGNVMTINNLGYIDYRYRYFNNNYNNSYNGVTNLIVDFDTMEVTGIPRGDSKYSNFTNWYATLNKPSVITYYKTNIPLELQGRVNLDVSFAPSLNGSVTRTQNVGGHMYTSNTLDMTITNNGSYAQYAMFIVNHGDTITIPSLTWGDSSKLFDGSPVYCYVRDQWQGDISYYGGGSAFRPSCFHPIGKDVTITNNIPWDSMNLQANTSYDVLVYGALDNAGDNMVSLDMSLEYDLVYSSTFTITDPAVFNPNSDSDIYPWDNTVNNDELFTIAKATQDQWGNWNIPNSMKPNYQTYSQQGSNIAINANTAFGNFFNFFNGVMSFLPPVWLQLIILGISAVVVVAIIKAVSS